MGLKVRDLYEVPAAAIVLTAHRELEKLVCTIHQNNFKGALESQWAYLCYAGLWLEPLRRDLDAYMDSVNEFVTGEVSLKLYRGSVTPVRRSSPFALYDRSLASFGESGGDFSQHASPGFIELFTMQSRLAHRIRKENEVIYELIGRTVVQALKLRYGREIRIAAGAGVVLTVLGVGAYLASRGGEEERGLVGLRRQHVGVLRARDRARQGAVGPGRVGARSAARFAEPGCARGGDGASAGVAASPVPVGILIAPVCASISAPLVGGFIIGTRPMVLLVRYQRNMDCFSA